jgi:hypothetical protein
MVVGKEDEEANKKNRAISHHLKEYEVRIHRLKRKKKRIRRRS